jgi:hypothetical protein
LLAHGVIHQLRKAAHWGISGLLPRTLEKEVKPTMSVKRTVTCRRSASKQLSSYGCELQRYIILPRPGALGNPGRPNVSHCQKWPARVILRRKRLSASAEVPARTRNGAVGQPASSVHPAIS